MYSKNREQDTIIKTLSKILIDDALMQGEFAYNYAYTMHQKLSKEGSHTIELESNKDSMLLALAIDHWIFIVYSQRHIASQVIKKNGLDHANKKWTRIYEGIINGGVDYFSKRMSTIEGQSTKLWSKVIREKCNLKQQVFQKLPQFSDPNDGYKKESSALNWTICDVAHTLGCDRNRLFRVAVLHSSFTWITSTHQLYFNTILKLLQ